MSPWQPPPRTTRTRLPALGNTPFLHFRWSCSLRPPLPLHSGRPLLILFVTTPSRCRMCGWLNWPMIVASRRKFHHWPSGDVSFRVLMATVLQSWPGILRFPRYTSPNSPGWKEHKVMARCMAPHSLGTGSNFLQSLSSFSSLDHLACPFWDKGRAVLPGAGDGSLRPECTYATHSALSAGSAQFLAHSRCSVNAGHCAVVQECVHEGQAGLGPAHK